MMPPRRCASRDQRLEVDRQHDGRLAPMVTITIRRRPSVAMERRGRFGLVARRSDRRSSMTAQPVSPTRQTMLTGRSSRAA